MSYFASCLPACREASWPKAVHRWEGLPHHSGTEVRRPEVQILACHPEGHPAVRRGLVEAFGTGHRERLLERSDQGVQRLDRVVPHLACG
jgi:hypothetical protein